MLNKSTPARLPKVKMQILVLRGGKGYGEREILTTFDGR